MLNHSNVASYHQHDNKNMTHLNMYNNNFDNFYFCHQQQQQQHVLATKADFYSASYNNTDMTSNAIYYNSFNISNNCSESSSIDSISNTSHASSPLMPNQFVESTCSANANGNVIMDFDLDLSDGMLDESISTMDNSGVGKSLNRGGRKQVKQGTTKRNARERNRVRYINNCFEILRERIPLELSNCSDQNGKSRKLSKVETLKYATIYIKQLTELLESANDYKSNLENESVVKSEPFVKEEPLIVEPSPKRASINETNHLTINNKVLNTSSSVSFNNININIYEMSANVINNNYMNNNFNYVNNITKSNYSNHVEPYICHSIDYQASSSSSPSCSPSPKHVSFHCSAKALSTPANIPSYVSNSASYNANTSHHNFNDYNNCRWMI